MHQVLFDHLPAVEIKCTYPITKSWNSNTYQLVHFGVGNYIIHLSGNVIRTNKDQLLLLLPNQEIVIEGNQKNLRIVSFRSKLLDLYSETIKPHQINNISYKKQTSTYFELVWNSLIDKSGYETHISNSCHVFLLLNEILFPKLGNHDVSLSESHLNTQQACGKNIIYATRYIRKNLCNSDLSLVTIAQALNYHPNYFCSAFKEVMSITPMKYVAQERLKIALKLLSTSNNSIETISEKVGVNNASQFRAFVKRNINLTPSEYRRKHKLNLIKND